MEYYIATAKLLQKNVLFKELSFKSYRNLLKCLIDEAPSKKIIFNIFNQIIAETTNLSKQDINNLSYIDYLLLLIYIRAYSFSDTLNLQLQEENLQPININLSLDNTIEYLLKQEQLLDKLNITFNNISVKLQLPSINNLYSFINFSQNSILFKFIYSIQAEDNLILFSQLSDRDKNIVIDNLSTNLFSVIKQNVEIILKELTELNFLKTIISEQFNKKIPILPDWDNIFYILKLVYNNSLENIYDYIFILTKIGNFTSEYLDACTPGEVFLYMKKLEESYSKSTTNNTNQSADHDDLPLDDETSLDDKTPFSDLPPVNSESPTAEF